jgi:hypothetical protein
MRRVRLINLLGLNIRSNPVRKVAQAKRNRRRHRARIKDKSTYKRHSIYENKN